jgi:hypothetical protein
MLLSQALLTKEEISGITTLLQIPPINTSGIISIYFQMPYELVAVKGGYKVRKTIKEPNGRYTYLSKTPLSKQNAERQLRAIYASEARKTASGRKK